MGIKIFSHKKKKQSRPKCDHEWIRSVETSGTTLMVITKCKKCGEIMTPNKTEHFDMR